MKSDRQLLGDRGEELAERHLVGKGYLLTERNYRCPHGEVDRVMWDGDTLVFVEVKTRRSFAFGSPAEAVDARKRRQITRSASHYLQEREGAEDMDCRFDVVEVALIDGSPVQIFHHVGVFDAEE
jgi:putative endonuclease